VGGGRPDLPTLCMATVKTGSEALLHRRWVKENSAAGSGFPPSPTVTESMLHLLTFPGRRDPDGSLTSGEGERERGHRSLV
jgi:hypothetical protein